MRRKVKTMAALERRRAKHVAKPGRKSRSAQGTQSADSASQKADIERKRNRLACKAHERFLRSGIEIQDVYGTLS
jgi:hypothetical protein